MCRCRAFDSEEVLYSGFHHGAIQASYQALLTTRDTVIKLDAGGIHCSYWERDMHHALLCYWASQMRHAHQCQV